MRTLTWLLVLATCVARAAAQCEIAPPQAQPPFAGLVDVDLHGDTLVLAGNGQRFAVFERGPVGWIQSASVQLDVSFALSNPFVALDGDRLAAGSPEDGPTLTELYGSVRVFERASGWQVPSLVRPDDGAAWHFFGAALDLAGDVLVVGAPQQFWLFNGGPGRAYVFEFNGLGWQQAAVLHPHDQGATIEGAYATCVATDGHTLAVGAPFDGQAGTNAGAVYLYERGPKGWIEIEKRVAPGSSAFGRSVAVDGSTLAVCGSDALHVFERTGQGWQPQQVLGPVDSGLAGGFGLSVAVDGDDLVVGAPKANTPGGAGAAGALHVYRRGPAGWAPVTAMPADGALEWAEFGRGLAVDGGSVLWSGTAAEPRLHDLGLGEVSAVCAGGSNSVGAPAGLVAAGCDSLLADALSLALVDAPPAQATWLRVGTGAASAPFGNGTLCVGGATTLLAVGASDAGGAWGVSLDLSAAPFDLWTPGDSAYLQAGFRDPGFGAGHGTSAAIALELQP